MGEERALQIGEAARRAGVSVRTLRHYDAIGLLSPSAVAPSGYRLYDSAAMARLEQILFFRELGFALEEIRSIMAHPSYDAKEAMRRHRQILLAQRARIEQMIARIDEAIEDRETLRVEEFDMKELEQMKAQYAQEVRERWGGTQAYAQSGQRTDAYGKDDWAKVQTGMEELMEEFAAVRSCDAEDAQVAALVRRWQQFITQHFYTCTDEILAGLGQMYEADARFRKNIDRHGEGTAACMARAIAAYCAAQKDGRPY